MYTHSTRPTTCDFTYADGGIRTFLATSSMTTNKPPMDGHVIHLAWDNSKWDG